MPEDAVRVLCDYLWSLPLNERVTFLAALAWTGEHATHGEIHVTITDRQPTLVKCEVTTRPNKQLLEKFQTLFPR